jgi:hypothetical protein
MRGMRDPHQPRSRSLAGVNSVGPRFGEWQGRGTTAARDLLFGRRATSAIAGWGSARRCAVPSCWSSDAGISSSMVSALTHIAGSGMSTTRASTLIRWFRSDTRKGLGRAAAAGGLDAARFRC